MKRTFESLLHALDIRFMHFDTSQFCKPQIYSENLDRSIWWGMTNPCKPACGTSIVLAFCVSTVYQGQGSLLSGIVWLAAYSSVRTRLVGHLHIQHLMLYWRLSGGLFGEELIQVCGFEETFHLYAFIFFFSQKKKNKNSSCTALSLASLRSEPWGIRLGPWPSDFIVFEKVWFSRFGTWLGPGMEIFFFFVINPTCCHPKYAAWI